MKQAKLLCIVLFIVDSFEMQLVPLKELNTLVQHECFESFLRGTQFGLWAYVVGTVTCYGLKGSGIESRWR
jgi:hypothetical protein